MPSARYSFIALAFGLLTVAGCGPAKLNINQSFPLDAGDAKGWELPAISKPQTVNIEFTSTATDVYVYLIRSEGEKKEKEELEDIPTKDKTLESKKGKDGNFSVEVPANTLTRVIVRGAGKKTDVTLKVTNKK